MIIGEFRQEATCTRFIMSDPSFTTFVSKMLKRKTRKDKDYFVLRTTIPKDIAEKINAEAGDFLFFKVKKAEWYHLLNWENMENAWAMLPDNVKYSLIKDGIPYPGAADQFAVHHKEPENFGATNPASIYLPEMGQLQPYVET
jgi:hypothetical protein